MSYRLPEALRKQLLEDTKKQLAEDPELRSAAITSEEFTEAFVRMAECREWPGSKSNGAQLANEFKEYCERIYLRELRKVLAKRHKRN